MKKVLYQKGDTARHCILLSMGKVVMIGHNQSSTKKIISKCVQENPQIDFLVVVTKGIYYRKSNVKSISLLLRKASFQFCLRRFFDMLSDRMNETSLIDWCQSCGIKYIETSDINSKKVASILRAEEPDLIVSTFTTHIIGLEVMNLSKIATIGTHPSKIPEYRGLEVFFWQLANNEVSSAISVFILSNEIDRGHLIAQQEFLIVPGETVRSLYLKITNLTSEILADTIRKVLENEKIIPIINIHKKSSYYPMPTRKAYRKFKQAKKRWA